MLTIGEFSRLSHVSSRMLRHYDLIGLLRPAHVGADNGYRYYDASQLATLQQIETLKGYGFKLAQIAQLLPLPPRELARQIHMQRLGTLREIDTLRRTLRQMESDIIQMEGPKMLNEKYKVIVMEQPPQKVFAIRRTISIAQTPQLFADLLAEAKRRGYTRTGPTQQMFMGEEFDYENLDLEAQVQVAEDGEGVHTIPGGTFIATTHIGPYETVKYAYDALSGWMAEHPEYHVAGPGIERYLKDEGMVQSPEEMETGVLFPVVKVEA